NNIAAYRNVWIEHFPIEWFDEIVDSSEVGLRKPDPAIYRLTAQRLDTTPEACLFLDDHPVNVAAAESVGMTGLLVGEDPWVALHELDGVLTARGPSPNARSAPSSCRLGPPATTASRATPRRSRVKAIAG